MSWPHGCPVLLEILQCSLPKPKFEIILHTSFQRLRDEKREERRRRELERKRQREEERRKWKEDERRKRKDAEKQKKFEKAAPERESERSKDEPKIKVLSNLA